jgi:ribosomal protein S18 acetylase RimI-like enzyme
MPIRPFCPDDALQLASLSTSCARGESDFVLNPLWESEAELFAEFDRFGIDPTEHILVADSGDGEIDGLIGFLRHPNADAAGLLAPIVRRSSRGRGIGGELLRAAQNTAREKLGIGLLTAGIGTRNRTGYSLLTSHGFRPVRQHFLMRCDKSPVVAAPPVAGLVLEPSRPTDASEILAIYRSCGFEDRTPEQMSRALVDSRHAHAVARHDGKMVAFAEIETHWPTRPWVAYVGVVAELRDRGVGSSLVAWALARRFDEGAVAAQLMLSPANRTALRAYEKVGFRRARLIDVLEKQL